MKILVAPLNWGLGHASRCVPLVHRLLDEGHEVILGGDGESLTLLRTHFPKLRYVYLAPLNLRYSKRRSQIGAMLLALPKLYLWALKDHALLKAILREEHIDQVISDNRFGLYINHKSSIVQSSIETVYITHQLHIMLPKGWQWLEPLVARLHARIYTRYNKVWIPDYSDPEKSLAGELSHPKSPITSHHFPIEYIGPLSRFSIVNRQSSNRQSNDIVAVLSGLEPQRTLLEQDILARYTTNPLAPSSTHPSSVLIVQGLMHRPNTRITRGNITIVPHLNDEQLVPALLGAKHIIARSGYSTIMDLAALGLLNDKRQTTNDKLELIPTPGQPEQEYLAARFAEKNAEKC